MADGEYSRRLLLIRYVVEAASERALDPLNPIGDLAAAWDLLVRAQAESPAAFRRLILDPHVGFWSSYTARLVSGVEADVDPLWLHLGRLASIAASSALLAGLDFRIGVPARDGLVYLPAQGRATLATARGLDVVLVEATGPQVGVTSDRDRVVVARPQLPAGPGWEPLVQVQLPALGGTFELSVDALDPYAAKFGLGSAGALSAPEAARWREDLAGCWALLRRDHPEQAAGLAAGLHTILPLEPGPGNDPRSGSSADAFGAAALSRRGGDAVDLAATLVHEFQHSMLNGLMHLVDLLDDDAGRLFYAPWRDDPRPLVGLLHGAYAFTAVTDFWHRRLGRDEFVAGQLAQFEFELCRQRTAQALATLREAPELTALGRRLLDRLDAAATGRTTRLSSQVVRLTRQVVLGHRATWQVHHTQPEAGWTQENATRWRAGEAPAPVPTPGWRVRTDPRANHLDHLAVLGRLLLRGVYQAGPVSGRPIVGTDVPGATRADLDLLSGRLDQARVGYLAEIAEAGRTAAWGGLGLALGEAGNGEGREPGPARVLVRHPERVQAVYDVLRQAGSPPPVIELAGWLAAVPAT